MKKKNTVPRLKRNVFCALERKLEREERKSNVTTFKMHKNKMHRIYVSLTIVFIKFLYSYCRLFFFYDASTVDAPFFRLYQ